ncbi:MAG: glutamate-1-semialdehyde 2,1-aminomutase [Opitutales bacterium]|nr:glutamate-1-semialdehyde 2,1-aminomutase [Opitutales bacterium]
MKGSQNSPFQRALKSIPGGVNSPVRAFGSIGGEPFFTERAQGHKLITTDGKTLIDYVGTWGPAIHGHNHPEIKSAIAEALEKGTSFGTPNTYEVPMAEQVIAAVPSVQKVRMVNSGTEATMSALRLARGFTQREKIIKFEGCYHGHSDALLVKAGSGALTHGNPDSAGVTQQAASDTILLPFNDLNAVNQAFEQNPRQIAAVILEPFPANMGLVLPDEDFLTNLQKIAHENGTLILFDEVMTGFRVAFGGVQELLGITPDLTAMGKIIGGGLPVGAFGGRTEIMDFLAPIGPVYQAGTLSGNPLAMAAGLKALELLVQHDPYDRLNELTLKLRSAMLESFSAKGIPVQIPTAPSMLSIFFSENPVRSFSDVMSSRKELFKPLFHGCLEKGVFLPPSPFEAWFISCSHDETAIDQTCEIMSEVIKTI